MVTRKFGTMPVYLLELIVYKVNHEIANAKEYKMHLVGRINRNIYECVTRNIITDEVIITEERIEHIKERHPTDFERI